MFQRGTKGLWRASRYTAGGGLQKPIQGRPDGDYGEATEGRGHYIPQRSHHASSSGYSVVSAAQPREAGHDPKIPHHSAPKDLISRYLCLGIVVL